MFKYHAPSGLAASSMDTGPVADQDAASPLDAGADAALPVESIEQSINRADRAIAKILEFHSRKAPAETPAKTPRILWNDGDAEPVVPDVLLRQQAPADPAYSPLEEPEYDDPVAIYDPAAGGPSLKALVFSTLAIAVLGGTLVFTFKDQLFSGAEKTSPLTSELSSAANTIEGLIARADGDDISGKAFDDRFTSAETLVEVDPSQLAAAKEKLRDSFALAGRIAPSQPVKVASVSTPAPVRTLAPTRPAAPAKAQEPAITPLALAESAPATALEEPFSTLTHKAPVDEAPSPSVNFAAAPATISEETPAPAATPAEEEQVAPVEAASSPAQTTDYPLAGRAVASVNMRQAADKNADVIGLIPADATLRYRECDTWWCSVSYNGLEGYVGKKFIEPSGQNG